MAIGSFSGSSDRQSGGTCCETFTSCITDNESITVRESVTECEAFSNCSALGDGEAVCIAPESSNAGDNALNCFGQPIILQAVRWEHASRKT